VSWHCLRDCRLRGEIKASRVGRNWIYSRRDLAQFLEQRKDTIARPRLRAHAAEGGAA
jgi:hypothetical protein